MKVDFGAVFDAFIKDTQKTFAHDRSKSVGASEVFGCLRRAWFSKRGKEFGFEKNQGAESWGATRRGDLIENHHIVPAMAYLPGDLGFLMGGEDQVTLFHGHNSGTPDGLIVGCDDDALQKYGVADIESDCFVVEFKSIDPRVALHEEKAIHRGQVQTQLGIIRETTEYKPVYGVILYVDASFLDDVEVFIIKFDPDDWAAAQVRANTVFEVDSPTDIMPEGKIDGGCDLCNFSSACAKVTVGAMYEKEAKVTDDVIDDAYELVMKRKEIEGQIGDLNADKERVSIQIKDFLRDHHTKKIGRKGVFSVSHYSQKGRTSLRTSELKAAAIEAGIAMEPFETHGDPFDVLRVTFSGSRADQH